MRKIILARHAETVLSKLNSKDAQRRNDAPLSDFGKKQAKEMADFLKKNKHSFNIIFTSLYLRSIQTAEIINKNHGQKVIQTYAFNEYFLRDDGTGVEGTSTGLTRTMAKLYSFFDVYDEILLVGHSSISKTILQALSNIEYDKAEKLFNNLGEIQVLRYDWHIGDKKWNIVDSFIPSLKNS